MTMQRELFDIPESEGLQQDYLGVPGLGYYAALLNESEQQQALEEVGSRSWKNDLKRQVQHYGYRYDYKTRTIDHSMHLGPLPDFANAIAKRLLDLDLVHENPDQLIVNEYLPGQGIAPHIDCEPCFSDTIVTVSLGSAYEMDFISKTSQIRSALLEVGSVLILSGDARYKWMHRIRPRKADRGVLRGRRVSLTYRKTIINGAQ